MTPSPPPELFELAKALARATAARDTDAMLKRLAPPPAPPAAAPR